MGVFTNAGENIEHFAPVGLGVLNPIRGQDRQSICARNIDKLLVHSFFATNEMPLNFDENIFAPERVDKSPSRTGTLRAILKTLGSARVSRAGDCVSQSRTFL